MSHRRKKGKGIAGSAAFVALLIVMLDVWGNMAVSGLVTSMLSTPYVNPPPKNEADKRTPTAPVPLFFQMEWTEGTPHDIDMWARCRTIIPGREVVVNVNYKQPFDFWLRLSKDDQGRPTFMNIEKIESTSDVDRVPPLTTCLVNAHLYNTHGGELPIHGKLVAIHRKDSPGEESIALVPFQLKSPGDEISLLEVSWDQEGTMLKDAIATYPAIHQRLIATEKIGEGR